MLLLGEENMEPYSNYEVTDLHLADSFSHYIDTNTVAGDELNITGGTAGTDIYLDNVDAHTVNAGTSAANLTIDEVYGYNSYTWVYGSHVSGEDDLSITTGTGDDTLRTSANAALRDGSSINLGTGENRLSLAWDETELVHGQALPYLMSPQFDTVAQTFDSEVGSIGDNIATAPTIAVDTKIEGQLQTTSDVDMFKVVLVAGQTYQFSVFCETADGYDYTLEDSFLRLLDASGNLIAQDDDTGHENNSLILFTAETSGTYYLEVTGYSEDSGTYGLEVVDRTSELTTPASHPLEDLAGLNFTGHLHQLDIMTDVVLAEDSETVFAMPGVDGQVEVLTFMDVEVEAREQIYADGSDSVLEEDQDELPNYAEASLTITGTAETLEINFGTAGDVPGEDNGFREAIVLEAVGVENLTLTADCGDGNFVINGQDLVNLVVETDTHAEIRLQGVQGGVDEFVDGAAASAVQDQLLNLESVVIRADDNANVYIDQIRTGASVTIIGDSTDGGCGDANVEISYAELGDVYIEYGYYDDAIIGVSNTDNSVVTLGNLSVLANEFNDYNSGSGEDDATADLSIDNNDDSTVTIGDIAVVANSDADLSITDNDGSTLDLGSLFLESRGYSYAYLEVSDNDNTSITVNGTVTVMAESDADFYITHNEATDSASTFTAGDIFLSSCGSDATLWIDDNSDSAEEFDMRVTLGSVTLDGATDAVVHVGNSDESDYNNYDVTVVMGDVTATAGTWDISDADDDADAAVFVINNDDSTITIGDIDLTSYGYDSQAVVRIDDNTGWRGDETEGHSSITTGSITAVSKGYAAESELHMDENSETNITIGGDVELTTSDDAYLHVYNNYSDAVFVINGDVTLAAGNDSRVNIADNDNVDTYDVLDLHFDEILEFSDSSDYIEFDLTIDQETYENVRITRDDVLYVGDNDSINNAFELRDLLNYKIGQLENDEAGRDLAEAYASSDGSYTWIQSQITGALSEVNMSNFTFNVSDGDDFGISDRSRNNDSQTDDMSLTINGDLTITAADQTLNNFDSGNATFNIESNVDDSVVITGALSLNGIDTGMTIGADNRNINLTFSAGAVSLTSQNLEGGDHQNNNADVRVYNNEYLTMSMDSLSVTADTHYALLDLDDNDKSEMIITGDVTIASGTVDGSDNVSGDGFATLNVSDNTESTIVLGVEYGDDGETVLERHEVSVSGNSDAYVSVDNNDLSFVDIGNITVVSGSSDAVVEISDNDDSTIATGSIDVTANNSDAWVEVSDNDCSDITVNGDINVAGSDADIYIEGNDFSQVIVTGSVSTNAANTASILSVSDNDYSSILILGDDGQSVTADDDADLDIDGNDYTRVAIASDVTLTAGDDSDFNIDFNDGSLVSVGVDLDVNGYPVSGTAAINQVTITADDDAEFSISDNDSGTDVYVGNLSMTASDDVDFDISDNNADFRGSDDDSNISVGNVVISASDDVNVNIHDGGEDTYITVGTFDIDAGNDVVFYANNTYGANGGITLGDTIDITAGLAENSGSYVDFELDDVNGADDITIDASTSNDSEVYAHISDSGDVESLTISGSVAEVYIEGESDAFRTLDIQNVTDFAYVETWDADFRDGDDALNAGDTVTVLIGDDNVQYNALYGYGDNEGQSYDWNINNGSTAEMLGYSDIVMVGSDAADWIADDGWFSLGAGQDFTPYPQVQTITGFAQYSYNVDNDYEWGIFYNTMQFDQSDISYRVQVEMGRYENNGEDDGNDDIAYTTDINYFTLQSGSWVELDQGEFENALGIDEFYYQGGYDGAFVMTGLADGTTFDAVRDIVQVLSADLESWAPGWSAIDDERSSNVAQVDDNIDLMNTNSAPDVATDGRGNDVAEIFTFTGETIGDIVIGGFFASPYAMETIDGNVRWADKLDFSEFLGGDLNDTTLDMTFTVDDGDGYFKDVIIDFTNEDYGSIRLVGAGEYNGTELELLNRVAQSVIFA